MVGKEKNVKLKLNAQKTVTIMVVQLVISWIIANVFVFKDGKDNNAKIKQLANVNSMELQLVIS